MHKMLCAWLFMLGVACARPAVVQAPTRDVAEELVAKTVALVEPGEDRPYCSGVWVSPTSFLTAYHCVVEDDELKAAVSYVVRSDVFEERSLKERAVMSSHVGALYAVDEEHDLALVRGVNPPEHQAARVGLECRRGERVQTMGHPRGLWWSYSSGDIAAIRDLGVAMIQATAPISFGSSGGGLFNSDGVLIGIASSQVPPDKAQNINLFVHAEHVDAFLRTQGGLL